MHKANVGGGELRAELSVFNDPAKTCWTWRCGQLNRNGWWWQNHRERKGLESVAKAEAAESACKKCIGRAGEVGQLVAGCEGESGEGGQGRSKITNGILQGPASSTEWERESWVGGERWMGVDCRVDGHLERVTLGGARQSSVEVNSSRERRRRSVNFLSERARQNSL